MTEKMQSFLSFLHCAEHIDYSIYSTDGELIEAERRLEFQDGTIKNIHLPFLLEHENELIILGAPVGMRWIGVYYNNEVHILGPTLEQRISKQEKDLFLSQYPISLHNLISNYIEQTPIMLNNMLLQYALMFYYALTGTRTHISRIIFESDIEPDIVRQDPNETIENLQNCWKCEQEIFASIKNGYNTDLKTMLAQYSKIVIRQIYPTNSLRNNKNLRLFNLALIVHAAISGGLPISTAYTLQAHYTGQIEACQHITALSSIDIALYEDFSNRMHNLKIQQVHTSTFLLKIQEYIDYNLEKDLSLKLIAKHFHYTEYYLSRKFKKEAGIRINEYIHRQKIERAKFLLMTTELSVSKIAERLNYSSVSYFISDFRKHTNERPTEFRSHLNI